MNTSNRKRNQSKIRIVLWKLMTAFTNILMDSCLLIGKLLMKSKNHF